MSREEKILKQLETIQTYAKMLDSECSRLRQEMQAGAATPVCSRKGLLQQDIARMKEKRRRILYKK